MNAVEKYLREARLEQLRRRNAKIPQTRPRPPDGPAMQYAVQLRQYQRRLNQLIFDIYEPLLETFRQDASTEQIETATDQAERTTETMVITSAVLLGIIGKSATTLRRWNDNKYKAQIYQVFGFNAVPKEILDEMLKSWTRENLKLIKGVNVEQIKKIETLLLRGGREGLGPGVLRREIQKAMKSSVSRATLIARDQVLKLGGQIDRVKQTGAGVTHFYWRTSRDSRVRPKHQAKEGQKYSWKTAPVLPGQEVNCRCSAEPSFDEILSPLQKAR